MMQAETWAERDLNEYLKRYAEGSDETERRQITCDICGFEFDYEDGKAIDLCRLSPIKIRGKKPDSIYICRDCYNGAENIGEDELWEQKRTTLRN
jgi:hypothetical protein